MREPRFWNRRGWQAAALLPLTALYRGAQAMERCFVIMQTPSKPVICVGNFTIGGAGKTPVVRWLCEALKTEGLNPAILSRGYKGGDEALLLAKNAPVFVGRDRRRTMRTAMRAGHDCAIKDDGFQNLNLNHCFNLLVVDGGSGLGNGWLLPAGPLREPLHIGLSRTNAILVLNEPTHESLTRVKKLSVPVFYGRYKATNAAPKRVFAYCGIAKPQKFYTSLKEAGYEVAATQDFSDHYQFRKKDADELIAGARALNATLITTEKDFMRFNDETAELKEKSEMLKIDVQIDEEKNLLALIKEAQARFFAPQDYMPH